MTEQGRINMEICKMLIQIVSEADDLEVMTSNFTQSTASALGIKGAALYILDPELEALELLASAGLSIDYVNKGPILVDKSIKIESNRQPVVISDTDKSEKLQYPEKAKEEGVRAIVSLPVVMRGKIIGSFRLYHSEPWEVSQDDMTCFEMLARYLGIVFMYFRVANAILNVKETVNEIHGIWL
jgi:signal transduction protein with GAF and PtsI domain